VTLQFYNFYKKYLAMYNHIMSAEFMTKYYSNGHKYTEGHWEDNIPIGDHIIWYETGGRKYQSIDFEDAPTMVTEWYENGQKKSKGAVGEPIPWKTGLWTEWYENGNKKSEGAYRTLSDDEFFAGDDIEGQERQGVWNFWHENGQLSCTGFCKDLGKKSLWEFWDIQGNKFCEHLYTTDEIRRLVNKDWQPKEPKTIKRVD